MQDLIFSAQISLTCGFYETIKETFKKLPITSMILTAILKQGSPLYY
jgi:hypothetical protein